MNFKVGDRVINKTMGGGAVIELRQMIIPAELMYIVLFDDPPPGASNMSANPSSMFEWQLEAEK